jgi:hypothetical protein
MAINNPQRKRLVLWEQQNGLCAICREPVDLEIDTAGKDPLRGSLDHITTRASGGKDGLHNLQLTHYKCNEARGHLTALATAAEGDDGDPYTVTEEAFSKIIELINNPEGPSPKLLEVLELTKDDVIAHGPGSCAFSPKGVDHHGELEVEIEIDSHVGHVFLSREFMREVMLDWDIELTQREYKKARDGGNFSRMATTAEKLMLLREEKHGT